MSTLSLGERIQQVRGYRQRKRLPDLNMPPTEGRSQAGTSTQAVSDEIQAIQQPSLPTIDVEALDDDVIESSPRAFAEAKNNAQRTRRSTVVVDLESERGMMEYSTNKRRRVMTNQAVINCDLYINLESSSSSTDKKVNLPPQPPPPKEPTFSCPICMGPFVEEMSTKCGHIFCKACIKKAITTQAKCPTCRKRVIAKDLIRVFLPSTSCV